MAFQDVVAELKEFDVNDMDFENVGSWPMVVKAIIWVLVFIAVLIAGYFYDIADLQKKLAKTQQEETDLRQQFESRAYQAANLQGYRIQMEEMEESFGALIGQLPSATEVPDLLEDIDSKGRQSGLEILSITPQPERQAEFYVELPIHIVVSGNYHDLGGFVSGIAGLARIVTLHDFDIKQNTDNTLTMNIVAKTYRYKDPEADDA
ncbi:MAG: type IV pilus assembly protein PilO [Paraglaciecola psychrophila]|jgi:type IV pilus assembly protein PilO